MKNSSLLAWAVFISLISPVLAIDLVVPNSKALVEGDGANGAPFLDSASEHYQQVYGASQFAVLGASGGMIDRIGFRYHGNYNTAPMVYNSMNVRLCTTTKAVDNLSTVFADNLGSDSRVVFSGRYTIGVTEPPSDHQLHSWPFPMTIPFSTPFYYNPTNGNLLLDIQWTYANTHDGTGPPWPDAVNAPDDSVSRDYAENIYLTYIPTNGVTSTIGLVTLFGVSPVSAPVPRFTSARSSGDNLLVSGTGGAAGLVYCILATTNPTTPLALWSPVLTNAFEPDGHFTFTNRLDASFPRRFYTLQIQ